MQPQAEDTVEQVQSDDAMLNHVPPPAAAAGIETSTQARGAGRDASNCGFSESTGPPTRSAYCEAKGSAALKESRVASNLGLAGTQQRSPAATTAPPARNKQTHDDLPALLLYVGSMHSREGLLSALGRQGIRAESFDPSDGPQHDITDDTVWDALMKKTRSGKFSALVAAPPTQSCSRNRSTGQPAFRGIEGKEHYGMPGLQPKDQEMVRRENLIVERTVIAALIIGDYGPVHIAQPAEAPDEPSLLKLDSMIALKGGPNTSVVVST